MKLSDDVSWRLPFNRLVLRPYESGGRSGKSRRSRHVLGLADRVLTGERQQQSVEARRMVGRLDRSHDHTATFSQSPTSLQSPTSQRGRAARPRRRPLEPQGCRAAPGRSERRNDPRRPSRAVDPAPGDLTEPCMTARSARQYGDSLGGADQVTLRGFWPISYNIDHYYVLSL